jgi:hypothetical protein
MTGQLFSTPPPDALSSHINHTHSWQRPNSGQLCCVDPLFQSVILRSAPYSATLLGYAAGNQPNITQLTLLTGSSQNVFTDFTFTNIAARISSKT